MTQCCPAPSGVEQTGKFFSKRSKWYARSFRKGKLEKIQKLLITEIIKEPLAGKRILDIGSGVGKLHLTLLRNGAESATAVDMSEEMIRHAKTFAQRFGVEQNVTYMLGDFMTLENSIPNADITLLDKVVCCYENLEGLVSSSADKTTSVYALIFPANNFLTKFVFDAEILISRILRSGFRPYWHEWNTISDMLAKRGFFPAYTESTFLWQVAVYRKTM